MQLISSKTIPALLKYREDFLHAKPFRYVIIDNFFETDFCEAILRDFPSFEEKFAITEMGDIGRKAVRDKVRDISPTYKILDDYLQTSEFLEIISEITGVRKLIYDPDYIGGGTHDSRDGQKLDPHVDFNYHPKTKTHRRLNLIVYLNHEWRSTWGGCLDLHSDPWNIDANQRVSILPLFNRAVIFETTENSWHGFDEIRLPQENKRMTRKSFAIYLYSEERPKDETFPPHATVYVPDSMPVGWTAGKILSFEDLEILKQRFAGLRGQLRFLYEREKHESARFLEVENALMEARNSWRLPVRGYVEQIGPASGVSTDCWVGPRFSAKFSPQRAVRGLEIEYWVSDQLTADQILSITIGERNWTQHIANGTKINSKIDFKCKARATLELVIQAAAHFVPATAGSSSDTRELAWLLNEIRFIH